MDYGVYKGKSVNVISKYCPDKEFVYGFDSFLGLPKDGRSDWKIKDFNLKGRMPKVNKNVKLIKGWFDQTLPTFLDQHPNRPISILHIDCDIYSSTKYLFETLKDRIVPGTIIIFDELLHYDGFENNEMLAWYQFVRDNKIKYEWIGIRDKVMKLEDYSKTKGWTFADFREKGYEQEVIVRIM